MKRERRNIEFFDKSFFSKKLFIVRDHATALIAWKKALDDGFINRGATLFHIDKHTDFCFDKKNIEKSKIILEMSDAELNDFVINNLHIFNDEYIANAMISGLIKDGISIHFDEGSDYGDYVKGFDYTTDKRKFHSNGIEHNFYLHETQNIANLIGYQRLIGDSLRHQDVNELFQNSENLILDLDLDFFTYTYDETYSRNPEDIKKQITSESFKEIFNKSKVITIALEPDMCGGTKHCVDIFTLMNEYWFKPYNLDLLQPVMDKFFEGISHQE